MELLITYLIGCGTGLLLAWRCGRVRDLDDDSPPPTILQFPRPKLKAYQAPPAEAGDMLREE